MKAIGGQLIFNTLIAIVLTAFFAFQDGAGRREWSDLGRIFVVNMIVSHSIGWLCDITVRRTISLHWHRARLRWPILVLTLLLVGFLGCMAATAVLLVFVYPGRNLEYWPTVMSFYRSAAIITLIIGIGASVFGSYRARIKEADDLLRIQELEVSRARLASLESRIQPHFLFNALNSIASLIREDPDRAERLVGQLASLLRSSLDTQEASLISLEREMKLVEDYLEIQQARFGGRLRFALDIPPALGSAAVPPFSVQTLVENAVKFAVSPRLEGGQVRVEARERSGRLVISVTDDGPGIAAGAPLPKGHGLDNLQSRLASLFGEAGGLQITREGVSIAVPLAAVEAHARLSA